MRPRYSSPRFVCVPLWVGGLAKMYLYIHIERHTYCSMHNGGKDAIDAR